MGKFLGAEPVPCGGARACIPTIQKCLWMAEMRDPLGTEKFPPFRTLAIIVSIKYQLNVVIMIIIVLYLPLLCSFFLH